MVDSEAVILLHGIGHRGWIMGRLARKLRNQDYQVLNITYPSRRMAFTGFADFVHQQITGAGLAGCKLSFVTHSMGGLVARAYIAQYRPEVGHVVMLGPPNQGSELADRFSRWPSFNRYFGPAAPMLMTKRERALEDQLGTVDYSLGIIAGTKSLDPILHYLLPRPHDGKVTVERTKLTGMNDHLALPVTHFWMMNNRRVIKQVLHYLQHGKFKPAQP